MPLEDQEHSEKQRAFERVPLEDHSDLWSHLQRAVASDQWARLHDHPNQIRQRLMSTRASQLFVETRLNLVAATSIGRYFTGDRTKINSQKAAVFAAD